MQNQRGQKARGVTAEEFKEVAISFDKQAREMMEKHQWLFWDEEGKKVEPIYCYDRPNMHVAAEPDLVKNHINASFLSHYSPDMNKPIEHVFGILTSQMHIFIRENRRRETVEVYKKHLSGLFFKLTPDSVQRDVKSLHETCKSILDAQGDWAPSHLS